MAHICCTRGDELTHFDLVAPCLAWVNIGYGIGLIPARYRATTWTNVDISSAGFCRIRPVAISEEALRISIHKALSNITLFKSLSHLPGGNELMWFVGGIRLHIINNVACMVTIIGNIPKSQIWLACISTGIYDSMSPIFTTVARCMTHLLTNRGPVIFIFVSELN